MIFTIAQSKADEERERLQNRGRGARGGEGGENPATGQGKPSQPKAAEATSATGPRTGLGIMSLATGRSRRSTRSAASGCRRNRDLAGVLQGNRRRRRRGAAGGRGGRGAGAPPAGGRGGQGRGGANARERKQPGSDLILRNLATGEEVTIPEVTEYLWNRKGTLLAYAISSNDATKDGAFVRRIPDGAVTTLHSGKGRYRSLTFDEAGQQITFLSDQAEFEKPVAPYRLYYWKSPNRRGPSSCRRRRRHAEGNGRRRKRRPALLTRRGASLPRHRPAAGARPGSERHDPRTDPGRPLVHEGPVDAADAARPR